MLCVLRFYPFALNLSTGFTWFLQMSDEEILATTRHWLEKAVIGLNLCPFAKAVYVKNQVRLVVSRARHADDLLEELDRELDLLVATPAEEIDTTLLIHATLFEDFLDFNDFLEVADGVLEEHDLEGVIQVASFHPRFQFDGTEPDDISNYTNRAPCHAAPAARSQRGKSR